MESDGGVHTGDGNGNGNGTVGKWVLHPFCDGNSNGKKIKYKQICILLLLLLPPPVCTPPFDSTRPIP